MNETQKRIKAYQDALPGLKERVAAVALLLVVSITMMTSATFAWLTISQNPEVTGVSTTVAANGNLEIALATGNESLSTAPGASQVGDSSAAEGQSVTAANLTWGNLVNLSDPAYGLDNLTLRPAQLNTTALLTSPLYGAVYSKDGRVETLSSNFAYTAWVPPAGNTPGYFGLSSDLGVRAISSTKVDAMGFLGDYLALKNASDIANVNAGNAFTDITRNEAWMNSLAVMMGMHMTATLNYEDQYINASAGQQDLLNLIDMYDAFIDAFELEAQAIANLLNTQLFLANGGDTGNYTAETWESVLKLTPNANSGKDYERVVSLTDASGMTSSKTVKVTNLKTFLDDYNMLVTDIETLRSIAAGGDYRWTESGLKTVINHLVNINNCIVDGKKVSTLLNEFNSDISSAFGYMNKEVECIITNGVLYNFEQRTGTSICVEPTNSNGKTGLPIKATVYVAMIKNEQSATIYASIVTSAPKPGEFAQELAYTDGLNTGADTSTMEVVAQDTYGLAVDLWVRTNSAGSYLTLEGNVLTETEEVPATGKDANGNTVELYTLSRTEEVTENDENGDPVTQSLSITYELYKVETTDDSGNVTATTWYRADTYSEFTLNDGEQPRAKMTEVEHVLGYEGENRVWQDNSLMSTDATTQGAGSCYVYYADTPEDQARSLELLQAFNVAFVDERGALLATAVMDTERFYADSGRVIVPLVISSDGIDLGADSEGNTLMAITALEQNTATRITAIVYLDGTKLSNNNVLAAADIQGQLNIQFGNSSPLVPAEDEKLQTAERSATAGVSTNTFDYDTHVGDMTTTVTVSVSGEQPSTVTAFFLRQINSTQGSREEVMTFTDNGDGTWTADYTFDSPGNYILRTIQMDGQEYVLKDAPTVNITGFALSSLNCDQAEGGHISIMTAASSSTVNLQLKFAADDVEKLPSTVQGRFLRDDGTAVNVNFTFNPTTQYWTGSATFLSSGDYTFRYLVLDGQYAELDESMWLDASVNLGMKVAVYTTSPTSFKYVPSEMTDNQKLLSMQVKIMDDTGEEMQGITGARLTYHLEGSVINTMDTDLTWDPVSGYYTGELKALESGGPGNWLFSKVMVGSNNITNDTVSPAFSIISPEPPSYVGFKPASYQFAPNGDAKMNIDIKYSATAKVMAVIRDADGTEYDVYGVLHNTESATNVTTWNFAVPKKAESQDGHWTMDRVYVWNFFNAAGDYVTAEMTDDGKLTEAADRSALMCIDMSGENYTTKVVQNVTVRFAENGGNADQTLTGTFLQTHTVSGINVDVYDFENVALPNITGMSLVYSYDGKTQDNGGYTSASISSSNSYFTVSDWTVENEGTHFVQSGSQTLQYAGSYAPYSFSFTVNGQKTYKIEAAATSNPLGTLPVYTVKSTAPTVTVSAISPTGTYSIDTKSEVVDTSARTLNHTETSTGCNGSTTTTNYYDHVWTTNSAHKTGYAPSISSDKLTATVYFKCVHADEATYSGGTNTTSSSASNQRYHAYKSDSVDGIPSVTLTLNGITGFTSATLNVSDSTHIYSNVTYTGSGFAANGTWETTGSGATYSWTSSGTGVKRYIGYVWGQKARLSDEINATGKKTPAGTITANSLTVVHGDGNTYTFTIPTVTINNPY